MNLVDVKYLIKYIEESASEKKYKFDAKETIFLNSIRKSIKDGHEAFSAKQGKWLNDIYIRIQNSRGHQPRHYV